MAAAGARGLFVSFRGVCGGFLKLERRDLSRTVSGIAAQSVSGRQRNITVRRILSCDIRSRDITSASTFQLALSSSALFGCYQAALAWNCDYGDCSTNFGKPVICVSVDVAWWSRLILPGSYPCAKCSARNPQVESRGCQ